MTGEAAVVVGAEGQGMVTGDMVNTAARLQSAAAPGTVLVGAATRLSTESAIAYEAAGDQVLKGKEDAGPGLAGDPRPRRARRRPAVRGAGAAVRRSGG